MRFDEGQQLLKGLGLPPSSFPRFEGVLELLKFPDGGPGLGLGIPKPGSRDGLFESLYPGLGNVQVKDTSAGSAGSLEGKKVGSTKRYPLRAAVLLTVLRSVGPAECYKSNHHKEKVGGHSRIHILIPPTIHDVSRPEE